ncbi:hypothetical protein RU639_003051 [Aspergillus parasiticus]
MFNSNPVIAVYKKSAEDSFKQIHSKILHVFKLLGMPTVAETIRFTKAQLNPALMFIRRKVFFSMPIPVSFTGDEVGRAEQLGLERSMFCFEIPEPCPPGFV